MNRKNCYVRMYLLHSYLFIIKQCYFYFKQLIGRQKRVNNN